MASGVDGTLAIMSTLEHLTGEKLGSWEVAVLTL